MADNITIGERILGSVHYLVYQERQLPGREGDYYLRVKDVDSLVVLMGLPPNAVLQIGTERIDAEAFRRDYMPRVRDVHFETNAIDKLPEPEGCFA